MTERTPKQFVGLHAHTTFSTFDGLGLPQEHLDFAVENGMDAMAITEHGNMNSFCHAHTHAKELKKKGRKFRYLPGVEAYYHPDLDEWRGHHEAAKAARAAAKLEKKRQPVADDDETGVAENEAESKDVSKWFDPVRRRHHLVLLPTSRRGLENIFNLVSRSFKEGFYRFPRIDRKMLKQHGEDVIVTSACIGGPFAYDVMHELRDVHGPDMTAAVLNDPARMEAALRRVANTHDQLADAVGPDHVFAELQFNSLPQQHVVNRVLLEHARRNEVQLTAAADSHYCRPEFWAEREIYKMLGRLNYDQIDASLLPQNKEQLKCELYPKNADQMWESYKRYCAGWDFYDDGTVCDAIERTWEIAHKLIGDVEPDLSIKLPMSLVRPGTTSMQMLIEMCKDGMIRMGLHTRPAYVARLKYELSVIKQIALEKGKDFSLYFVTQRVITEIAERTMLIGCGRGSAAGSLINYVLGITSVDPIKYGLIFERFLNPARAEMPDIDSDFEDVDQLVNNLKGRFGNDNVLPITNYNTLKLKSLVKDLGRLYGLPFDEVNDLTSKVEAEVKPHMIDAGENKSLFELKFDDCMQHSPRFRDFMEKYPQVGASIKVLFKQNKSIGCHASGVLIAEGIDSKMPVIVTRNGPQAPWVEGLNYKHLGDYGFVKFDLLGLDTLRIIRRAIELIIQRSDVGSTTLKPTWPQVKAWYDEHLHPDQIDFRDQRVYEYVYHAGRWAGIFQFTSPGAQRFIKQFEPRTLDDIAVATAIYRPGPLAGHYDKIYLKAKKHPEEVIYDHPAIKEVLGYTYGTLVFQEQLMALANKLAGMSLPDCDRLRKAIVKRSVSGNAKNKGEIVLLEETFIEGAVRNGLARDKAQALFENMAAFAGYAFNASVSRETLVDTYEASQCTNGAWSTPKRKRITKVKPGDLVRSQDQRTGKQILVPVVRRHDNGKKKVVKVTLTTGETVTCTWNHKFRTVETGEMLPLREIVTQGLSIVVDTRSSGAVAAACPRDDRPTQPRRSTS
jgi:DNA polymerase-3 subunit alpha